MAKKPFGTVEPRKINQLLKMYLQVCLNYKNILSIDNPT